MIFTGRVAVVTGAGAGIGRRFASALATEGASVVIADVDPVAGRSAAEEIEAEGGAAFAVAADVRDLESATAMAASACERFGRIDILVNNAGRHLHKYARPCSEIDIDLWEDLLAVNLTGTLKCTRACIASMPGTGGAVVNISSAGGIVPTTAYGVSKRAVIALTVSLASELAHRGIRVNAIAPGMVDSPAAMSELDEDFRERIIDRQRIKRMGRIDDLLGALFYLCSDASSFVTGQTLVVDGGMAMQ